jgi:dUTP pyrophosphatase
MDKDKIDDYIERLKNFDSTMSTEDENFDPTLINELNNLLSALNDDIANTQGEQTNNQMEFSPLSIRIKKLKENAVIPKYSKDGDAGLDLTATHIISETMTDITYGFGISVEIPKGYVGLVFPRSSIRKYDMFLTNAVGVIDSGYRGEIQATFKKTEGSFNFYSANERIAQIMVLPYPKIEFVETDELSDSERNTGGFGSTGI